MPSTTRSMRSGCAVFDENGQALAAISLSGPKARIVDNRLSELGSAIRQTAVEITQVLGGRIPADQG